MIGVMGIACYVGYVCYNTYSRWWKLRDEHYRAITENAEREGGLSSPTNVNNLGSQQQTPQQTPQPLTPGSGVNPQSPTAGGGGGGVNQQLSPLPKQAT